MCQDCKQALTGVLTSDNNILRKALPLPCVTRGFGIALQERMTTLDETALEVAENTIPEHIMTEIVVADWRYAVAWTDAVERMLACVGFVDDDLPDATKSYRERTIYRMPQIRDTKPAFAEALATRLGLEPNMIHSYWMK
jgi:hypothetical protein